MTDERSDVDDGEQMPLRLYPSIAATWPATGRHVLALFDDDTVVVYQAFNKIIAEFAVAHQTFAGCPAYSMDRMTWIKTNFLWMMYRCGWCTKDVNQERVLALRLSRVGFESLLRISTPAAAQQTQDGRASASPVIVQWDPDHGPTGGKQLRRAIQIGIRGSAVSAFLQAITSITDITDTVVKPQAAVALAGAPWATLKVPPETLYTFLDPAVGVHVGASGDETE